MLKPERKQEAQHCFRDTMFTCRYLCFVFAAASQFITGVRGVKCKGVIEHMNVTKPYTKYLQSPGYARHDGSNPTSPCQWLLRAEGRGGDFLYLYVLAMAIDDFTNSPCSYRDDRVDIYDGSDENSPLLVTLCKQSDNGRHFYSSQPFVFVNFIFQGSVHDTGTLQGRGFYLQIESVDISQKTTTKSPPNESGTDDDDSIVPMAIGGAIFFLIISGVLEKCRRNCLKPSSVAVSPADTATQSPANPSAPTLASTVPYVHPHSHLTALDRVRAQEEFVRSGGDEISSPQFGRGNTDSSRYGFASSDEMSSPRFGGGNTDLPSDGYVSSDGQADTGYLIVGEAPPSYESVVNGDSNAQEEVMPSGGDEISSPRFGGGNTDSPRDGYVSSDGLTDTGYLIVGEVPPSYECVVNGDSRLQLSLPVQPSEATVVTDITPKPE